METESVDSRRTVVASGVPDVLPVSRMVDKLTIHFQSKRRSRGGDVDVVTYPTNMDGVAFVTFDKAEDADRVVKQEQQIMMDDEFPRDYSLTVFPFSRDVFLYVPHASVDLSVFGSDQDSLIRSLQSAHRSIRFQPFPQQRKATIEGPFSAVQALREDLIRRASRFKPSANTAALQRRETSPRPPSRADQVSRRTPEAQSLFSKGKSQNISEEGLGGSSSSDKNEKALKAQGPKTSTKYRTESTKPSCREVVGGETKTEFVSSSSRLDPLLLKETSAKHQRGEGVSEDPSWSSGNHLDSHYSSVDYLKNPSSSVAHAVSPLVGQRHVSTFTKRDVKAAAEQRPGDSEDIWVDLYTFRYIEKFYKKDLDEILGGAEVITECYEGSDLIRLSVTEKQPSKAASRMRREERLKTCIEIWQSNLRVQEIFYDKVRWPSKKKLTQICEEANLQWNNVLYIFEDSCIKVIGPSGSSFGFSMAVENNMKKHEVPSEFLRRSREVDWEEGGLGLLGLAVAPTT